MATVTARIFRNGRNQAVRIPVEYSFAANEVTIERHGDALLLRPAPPRGWDRFLSDPSLVLPEDFELAEDLPPQERSRL